MWSIKDRQTGRILASGRNRDTKEGALEGAFEYWVSPQTELTKEEVEKLKEDEENWLNFVGLVPIEHDNPIEC